MKNSQEEKRAPHPGNGGSYNNGHITQQDNTKLINYLQQMRNIAWHNALKYKFDPAIGQTHQDYLDMLNTLLEAV